ncbi:hypothetical protein BD770DRAFT_405920 [Pilaira anomala]|nr:hypothetical protein BD770DRAFT_405920 [Pilaira anomala]
MPKRRAKSFIKIKLNQYQKHRPCYQPLQDNRFNKSYVAYWEPRSVSATRAHLCEGSESFMREAQDSFFTALRKRVKSTYTTEETANDLNTAEEATTQNAIDIDSDKRGRRPPSWPREPLAPFASLFFCGGRSGYGTTKLNVPIPEFVVRFYDSDIYFESIVKLGDDIYIRRKYAIVPVSTTVALLKTFLTKVEVMYQWREGVINLIKSARN